jgi:uncharacterized protein (TIGR03435 family)
MSHRSTISKLAILTLSIVTARAQPRSDKPQFDVASIKAVPGDGVTKLPNGSMFFAGPRVQWSGSTLTLQNYSARDLIRDAYNLRDDQIVFTNHASWIDSTRYLIVAKAAQHTSEDQARAMTQTLLAERFNLQVHRETRELPAYALVVDKNGPKLKPKVEVEANDKAVKLAIGPGHISQPLTMAALAQQLSTRLGRPVSDMTSLKGEFDVNLNWTPDENEHDPLAGLPHKPDSEACRNRSGLGLCGFVSAGEGRSRGLSRPGLGCQPRQQHHRCQRPRWSSRSPHPAARKRFARDRRSVGTSRRSRTHLRADFFL